MKKSKENYFYKEIFAMYRMSEGKYVLTYPKICDKHKNYGCKKCDFYEQYQRMSDLDEEEYCVICECYWDNHNRGQLLTDIGLICDECSDKISRQAWNNYKKLPIRLRKKYYMPKKQTDMITYDEFCILDNIK